ncbi:hypothetical protein F4780DRAFT_574330 [Xylariomycetidae sp. FL0641]|nr:hypothetical protein F4780DRAFT_574330 [Xylariomycetidae sp. FL0641]
MMDVDAADDQQQLPPVNGNKHEAESPMESRALDAALKKADGDDTANEAELSPPPDSSSVSSVNPDMLGDEIVVGTHANGSKASPQRARSMTEDAGDMIEDIENGDDEPAPEPEPEPVSAGPYPKRKRTSVYSDLDDAKIESASIDEMDTTPIERPRPARSVKPEDHATVLLGYLRESMAPELEGRPAVFGFMDIRARLRTRAMNINRDGQAVSLGGPPSNHWVTFERIVFEDHLVGLNHHEIKEYVKIRSSAPHNESPAEREQNIMDAVQEAKRRIRDNPPPETPVPVQKAYGVDLPSDHQPSRSELKRRRLNNNAAAASAAAAAAAAQQPSMAPQPGSHPMPQMQMAPEQFLQDLPGSRPTRILIGSWAKSEVADPADRLAVFGILGANDMFRVKLVRETIDGRFMTANYPTGAGHLWIPYDEVIFLDHINKLSRPEMKEYTRIRQYQIDQGETPDKRIENETKAVFDAQRRAAAMSNPNKPPTERRMRERVHADSEEIPEPHHDPAMGITGVRLPRREMLPRNDMHGRPSLPEAEIRQLSRNTSMDSVERVERVSTLASREVARMEAIQMRNDRRAEQNRLEQQQRQLAMEQRMDPQEHRRRFNEDQDRMQQVWRAQEQNRSMHPLPPLGPQQQQQQQQQQAPAPVVPAPAPMVPAGPPALPAEDVKFANDAKYANGVKYERKPGGPFAGKLVSNGTIISIDGEDYVEYRVLTKPSFF